MESEQDRLMRVAIIGCGGIARAHYSAYRSLPDVEIVGLADIDPSAISRLGEGADEVASFTDAEALLQEARPDLVSVCTWAGLHASMVVASAEAGVRGIMCEKPLARALGEIDRMVEACRRSGTLLASGHHHRFDPVNERARAWIADGAIGAPRLLRCRTNRGLLNNGSHGVDLMRYLLGDPSAEWIVGQIGRSIDRWERGERIEEFGLGLIGFPNDAQAILETDLPGPIEFFPTIVGESGAIYVAGDRLTLVNPRGSIEETPDPGPGAYRAEIAEMVAWVRGGPVHRSEATHGRAAIEILMALFESARTHSRIDLPLERANSPLEEMIDAGALPVARPGRVDI